VRVETDHIRRARRAAIQRLCVALATVGIALAAPAVAAAAPGVPTQLSNADLTLMNGVRTAGLWEMPAGQMAAERGSHPIVRQIGAMIAQQHVKLDQDVVDAANQLNITLPSTPTAEQNGWLHEMQAATSNQEFDQIFVARLRAAHGKIFPIIAAVRAGTRNEIVRKVAEEANTVVEGHLEMLESTNLVRYAELPPVALPQTDIAVGGSILQAAQGRAAAGSGFTPGVVWVVLIAAIVTAVASSYRVFRPAMARAR
jgi:predicted outer membrane protein